jgi:hypothetical protein
MRYQAILFRRALNPKKNQQLDGAATGGPKCQKKPRRIGRGV